MTASECENPADNKRDAERGDDFDDDDLGPVSPPLPLDGGYGWVVVAASLLCNIIVDGVCFSFGVLYLELLDYYGESKGKTAWVGSLVPGMYLMMGPVVSALANHFGCRAVTIVGSILASFSFFICTFSPNVSVLIFTYGVMGGIGFGLMYLPSIVIVGYYFDKKRALATGVAVCGSGIGTFIFGPFTRMLMDNYGWKGTQWIIAGIVLNGVACGALFRPLEDNQPIEKKPDPEDEQRAIIIDKIIAEKKRQRTISTGSMDGSLITKDNKFIKDPEEVKKILEKYNTQWQEKTMKKVPSGSESIGVPNRPSVTDSTGGVARSPSTASAQPPAPADTDPLATNGGLQSSDQALVAAARRGRPAEAEDVVLQHPQVRKISGSSLRSRKISTGSMGGGDLHHSTASLRARAAAKPLYRQDIFYSGSVTSLAEYKSTPDMNTYVQSYTSIPAEPEDPDSCEARCLPLVHVLKEMLDFSLMRSMTFVILCTASVLAMTGFFTPFVYVTDLALKNGLTDSLQKATLLLSVLGIFNTIGRVISGWLSDRPWADCLLIHNLALIIAGLATCLVPFIPSFPLLAAYCAVFGLCIAAYIALRSIVLTDLIGVRKLMNSLGLLFLFQGLASVVGSPMCAAYIALRSIVLVDLLGIEKLTNSLGIILLFQGLSCVIGSPLAGAIYDSTGSYTASFMVSGGLIALAGVICLPIRCINRWELRKDTAPDYHVVTSQNIGPDDYISNPGESKASRMGSKTSKTSVVVVNTESAM